MTSTLIPAALAEIRERDAKTDPELFEYDNIVGIVGTIGMPKLVSAVRDRRALLADYGEREKRTAGLVHELLECQAEVSRLTAELAAARKPQGLKLPRETDPRLMGRGWTLSADLVKRVRDAYRAKMDAALPDIPLGAVETVLLAAESLGGARDGGEQQP